MSLALQHSEPILGESRALAHVLERVDAVAKTQTTVLLSGESGVGKELVAQRIHDRSARRDAPFVSVNCASISRDLFESEFFGHVRGAFTGATQNRAGRIEAARKGTLFLDEVSEIPVELQSKLLRVLQNLTFERVGDDRTRQADVRIVAATNRDLEEEVAAGRFRLDLYYRLAVFPIEVPPLRERLDDIPILARHFLKSVAESNGHACHELRKADERRLETHEWPGNVRELKNVMERAYILSGDGPLRVDLALPEIRRSKDRLDSPHSKQQARRGFLTVEELREFEVENLLGALEAADWKVFGPKGAAALLGMKPTTLASRLKALKIKRPDSDSLYVRLGGHKGISQLARDLFGRVVSDDRLSRFWENRSTFGVLREEQLLVSYLAEASGGPSRYVGRNIISAHRGLDIDERDWRVFELHLHDVLSSRYLDEQTRREIDGFMVQLQPQIVGV